MTRLEAYKLVVKTTSVTKTLYLHTHNYTIQINCKIYIYTKQGWLRTPIYWRVDNLEIKKILFLLLLLQTKKI